MSSPAERYAAFRKRQETSLSPERADALRDFIDSLPFSPDAFQVEACEYLARDHDVLVAAPTGAGKTVVGELAVSLALAGGTKAFYTTPIKALSNQKYLDLAARYGHERVGLLTGDVSINGEAPVVVMTTEVLRNMIYAGSSALADLGYVVMDEVHYLADATRGGVWEEVILLLEGSVRLVSLSATVSNTEEFGRWLTEVRGTTSVVVSETRPVPLWQHLMVRQQILDLYAAGQSEERTVNPEVLEAVRRAERGSEGGYARGRGRGGRDRGRGGGRRGGREGGRDHAGARAPRREVVVDRLDAAGLLPAIVFVFSRAGCEAAVDQVLRAGVRLTTQEEQRAIAAALADLSLRIPGEDLEAVGFEAFSAAARRGVAAHHAGMLPTFKETVEHLFVSGLLKVVFATETLALGVNMPARSVVLERLVKWDGQRHAAITAGEYTQLTGRAGRRGIDVEGHAIVLYASGVDPQAVAGLASRRTYPLRSSFHPTYNMAVNLLRRSTHDRVREVLEQSFAQFQADAGVVHLARQLRRHEEGLAGYTKAMACHLGDVEEYLALRRRVSDLEASGQRERSVQRRWAVADSLAAVKAGDVVEIPRGRRSGWAVVLERGAVTFEGVRLTVLTTEGRVQSVGVAEAPDGVRRLGRVRIPRSFERRDPRSRRDLASAVRSAVAGGFTGKNALPEGEDHDGAPQARGGASAGALEPRGREGELAAARRALRAHRVHGCAEREDHLRWARRAETLVRERDDLNRRIAARTSSIARDFDRVCEVLLALGYLERDGAVTTVTEAGTWLRRLYSERDLVLAQCLRSGAWDQLTPPELAAAATSIVYTSRGEEDLVAEHAMRGLPGRLVTALDAALRMSDEIGSLEREVGLDPTPHVDLALVRTMYGWAQGLSLGEVLAERDLGAGDFVRWCRQVLDVLDQLSVAAPHSGLRARAREAIELVRRGVVGGAPLGVSA